MTVAVESLDLDRMRIVYTGDKAWPVSDCIHVCPNHKVHEFVE